MTRDSLSSPLTIGLVLYPQLTQLDLTGPYEVFARVPDTQVRLVAETLEPVRSERGLAISPDVTFEHAPQFDIVFVPGGNGVSAMMEDDTLLRFLERQALGAQYVTSVCTGALILGAAGLLRGYRATTHWLYLDLLPLFGAQAVEERVVIDRDRVTGGGVTAGIDFGLTIAAEMRGRAVAEEIQLMLEYDPAPPFTTGSPKRAPAGLVQRVTQARDHVRSERRAIAARVNARSRAGGRQ